MFNNVSPRPKSPLSIINDSWEVEEDENVIESFRDIVKPLISNINKAREEIKEDWYQNLSQKSSTPNSKNMGFDNDFSMKIENDSCSLGDVNEMNEQSVRKSFLQYGRKLKGENIDLSHKNLYEISHQDLDVTRIISLDLRSNRLIRVPPMNAPNLKFLHTLRLDNNQIWRFPDQIFSCQLLETLTLTNNHITYIPSGIKSLCHLEVFHISKNPIRYISNKLKEWTSINDICLDWINYINFESTTDNSRAEEDKNADLWRVIKLVLFYNIDQIILKREVNIETPEWGNRRKDLNVLVKSNIPIAVKEKSLSFTQFIEEALKIIHKNQEVTFADQLLLNGGNALHMAVELNHHDYIKFLASAQIPLNTTNKKGKTPFHIAVSKNRLMKK